MITIRPYKGDDWLDVERINQEGIDTGVATFDTSPKLKHAWENETVPGSQLIATDEDGTVLGWAVLWPTSDRCAYAGVAEVSVYVSSTAQGKGVGKKLLLALVTKSEELGLWTLQAGIFEDNTGSIALHKSCGFRLLGIRERIGKLNGVWRNNMQWERRSKIVGID